MGRVVVVMLVIGLLIMADVRSRAAGPDEPSIESSNQVSLAQLRRTASEQQTNAVAWLNYGRAALKDITAQMVRTAELPGTNAYDEALYALGKGLQLDATNYKLHSEIATVYNRRAIRKPSEDDQTKYADLETALEHYSLAASNAPSRGVRAPLEWFAAHIRERMEAERAMERSIEAYEKASPSEKQQLLAEGAKRAFASDKNQRRLEDARKRAQREPENTAALLDYAELLIRVEYQGLGNANIFDEVHVVLGKAIGLDAHSARAYELMGLCVDLQGEETNALVYYKQALKENPNSQSIRDRIKAIEGRVSYILQLEHSAENPSQP